MKPLILISSLATGGAERVVVTLMRRLAAEGVAVTACTVTAAHDGPLAAELRSASVRRLDLGARRLADPRALPRLLRLIRGERSDLVHAHGQDASILAAAARQWTRRPLVVTRHVLDEPARNWRQHTRAGLTLRAIRQADAPVAVSKAAAERLSHLTGLEGGAIRVIHNGIDTDRFATGRRAEARAKLAQAHGITKQDRLVLVPAVLREGKGHDLLISVLPLLRTFVPEVRVLFAGAGELEPVLRAQARPHAGRVVFLGDRSDMPDLFAACDLVVLPSMAEALPTVLIEAAAAARPVVAMAVGGTPEVVEHDRTGLLVPACDGGALVQAIAALLQHPPRAARMGCAAARRARQCFSLERHVDSTLALWAELIERCRS